MLYGLSKFLHVASVITWVGGMFFAYMVLRPAAGPMTAPERLSLWVRTFERFFPGVWAAVAIILATGLGMIFLSGGMGAAPLHVHVMFGLGLLMMLIFAHVFFAPYKRLRTHVAAQRWEEAGKALAQIRKLVALNTTLGFIVTFFAAAKLF